MAETEVDYVVKHECKGHDAQCVFDDGKCVYADGWIFYDEGYMINGPFQSEHEARLSLFEYCHVELGPGNRWVR